MLAEGGKEDGELRDRVQTLSAQEIERRRRDAVTAVLASLRGGATCYGERLGPGDGLAALPIFTGAELATESETHPPFGRLQVRREPLIRTGLTTAAVPRPTAVAWSRADLDCEALLGARALARAGAGPRSRISDCLEGGLVSPGTLAATDALDALDALALPVGPVTDETALRRVMEVWEIVQPSLLIVDAATESFLRVHVPARHFAVLLTPTDAVRLSGAARDGTWRIFSVPQVCTFLAGECAARCGYHIAEDAVAAEIVDSSSGARLADGKRGRLLVSSLARSLAVLRFDTGLDASIDRSPCRCGETHARLIFGQ
jgi:phenylacetate-CoA ligase